MALTIGDPIHLELKDNSRVRGVITAFHNDTVYVSGLPVDTKSVSELILPERPKRPFANTATIIGITAGAGLTAAGLALSKQQEPGPAVLTGLAIGFGPLLVKHFGGRLLRAIPRKKFRIGKKFRLQVLDLAPPRYKSF